MALTDSQKASLLFKQANGVAETTTARDFFEEPIAGKPIVMGSQIWGESESIPTTAPGGTDGQTTGVVRRYLNRSMTAVPGTTNSFYLAELVDAIPFNFGDGSYNYAVKSNTDVTIPFGQGDWIVNPAAGTLTFYGTVPANMPPKISFYKYVGGKGAGNQAQIDAAVDALRQEIAADVGAANGIAPLDATTKVPVANIPDLGDLSGTLPYNKLVIADDDLTIAKTSGLQASLDAKLDLAGGTMTGNIAMGTNKITSSYVPVDSTDLVNKTALDNAISGLSWKPPVQVFNLLGNLAVADVNLLTPAAGDQYVMTDAGTLTAGSLSVAAGDIVEFNGAAWFILEVNVGGYPRAGLRAVLAGHTGTVGAPYTNATDQDKIVSFSGSSLTGTITSDTADKVSVSVQDDSHASVFDNASYVYEGSVPSGQWVQFNGAGQIAAGVGIQKVGNTLSVRLGAGIAELPTGEVGVEVYADGGLMLTQDGSTPSTDTAARLKVKGDGVMVGVDASGVHLIDTSITAAKLAGSIPYSKLSLSDEDIPQAKVSGLVSDLASKADDAVVVKSVNGQSPTAGAVTIGTDQVDEGSTNLYFTTARAQAAAVADALADGVTDIAPSQNAVYDALVLKVDKSERNIPLVNDNASAITAGQIVYVKGNGHVDLAKADAAATSAVKLGLVAATSIDSAFSGNITFQGGLLISGFSSLTPGDKVFLSPTTAGAVTQTIPTTVGHVIVEVGEAITATTIEFRPKPATVIAS